MSLPGQVLADIEDERERQDREWGGEEHDDKHDWQDWLHFIEHQEFMMRRRDGTQPDVRRQRFVKIAALAIAAIESLDRKNKA